MKKKFKDLKVKEWKEHQEDRELQASGKKSELQDRLKQALIDKGRKRELLEFHSPIEEISRNSKKELKLNSEEISRNSKNFEEKLQFSNNKEQISRNLKEELKF